VSSVWSVPVTGGEPTLAIQDAAFPTPLPDGKTVAYVGDGGHNVSIASVDDPGSARVLISATAFGLMVSPDGTRLAYSRADEPPGISVVDAATGALAGSLRVENVLRICERRVARQRHAHRY
jgi:hypothetical protein